MSGVRKTFRGILVSLVLALGLIALTNLEMPMENAAGRAAHKNAGRGNTWRRIVSAASGMVPKSRSNALKEDLRAAMEEDELAGGNPFNTLGSGDALGEIFKKEMTAFERKTLRSPAYHDESGYDLVHYEILHGDGTKSSVLAYIDHETRREGEGAPEVREEVPVVMVLTSIAEKTNYALYRGGTLEETSTLIPEEGLALLNQRLEAGIPFLSVSR